MSCPRASCSGVRKLIKLSKLSLALSYPCGGGSASSQLIPDNCLVLKLNLWDQLSSM